jgi:hypothetical protein
MRVCIVAPAESEWTERQHRFFMAGGHECRLYIQEQSLPQDALSIAASPNPEQGHDITLYVFHYIDEPYPLLETIRHLRHGFVALDLSGVQVLDKAPAGYADFCLVTDAVHKRALNKVAGYPLERIYVLSDQQNYDQAWGTILSQVMQGIPSPSNELDLEKMTPAENELEKTLLINDPALDRPAILDRVRQAIRRRMNDGGYGPDVTSLGPETLRPALPENQEADRSEVLLRLQIAFDELATQSHLREPEFRSDVPWLGPLIVAVRRFWNWMSTKWYVRGWMAQQVDWNARMFNVVSELLEMQESNERRIHELELRLEKLDGEREHAQ